MTLGHTNSFLNLTRSSPALDKWEKILLAPNEVLMLKFPELRFSHLGRSVNASSSNTYFMKAVEIQLTHKRAKVAVLEKLRQNHVLEFHWNSHNE